MSDADRRPGEPFDVRLPISAEQGRTTSVLMKAGDLQVIRLILPAGQSIPSHKARGTMTLLCLEGRIAFESAGRTEELAAGQMLYLPANELHAVTGLIDAMLLLTIWTPAPASETPKDAS